MSVLEIILYSALGLGVAIYLTIGIIKLVKKKKKEKTEVKWDDYED